MDIIDRFLPGAIGRIAEMHGQYYAREWNLGIGFEARVAEGCGAFALRYDEKTDLVLLALKEDRVVASLILDLNDPQSDDRGAHLRFFILDDEVRGSGIGGRMLDQAIDHADRHAGGKCWLTTFAGLDAARHMYEKRGFRLTEESAGTRWGHELIDQTFEKSAS